MIKPAGTEEFCSHGTAEEMIFNLHFCLGRQRWLDLLPVKL